MRLVLTLTILTSICSVGFVAAAESPIRKHWLLVPEKKKVIHVFDVLENHKYIKTIKIPHMKKVRGITGDIFSSTIFIAFEKTVLAFDPITGSIRWSVKVDADPADRLEITRDGKKLFVPAGFDSKLPFWYVLDSSNGKELGRIKVRSGSHNTIVSLTDDVAYLASLKYEYLTIVSTESFKQIGKIGPFANFIRPFTINSDASKVFVNLNGLLGFQVGDLKTGKVGAQISAEKVAKTHPPHHGCPSHGIGLRADEKEVWVVDSEGDRMLVFDATKPEYPLIAKIPVGFDPGWITFDLSGKYAYPSTGEIIDVQTKSILGKLKIDEKTIASESKLDFILEDNQIVELGSQFGLGRANGKFIRKLNRQK